MLNKIITEMGFMEIKKEGSVLTELHLDYTVEQIQAATEAELIISPDIKKML